MCSSQRGTSRKAISSGNLLEGSEQSAARQTGFNGVVPELARYDSPPPRPGVGSQKRQVG
jgi:hypothetical protein